MRAFATVGVHDDLAASEARVAVWAADDELARRIDVIGRALVEVGGGDDRMDDLGDDLAADLLVRDLGRVLRRNHHCLDSRGLAIDILDGHLALAVGTEVIEDAFLANQGKALGKAMCDLDRHRHQLQRLVASCLRCAMRLRAPTHR